MRKTMVILVALASMALAPAAVAGSSLLSAYGNEGSKVVVEVKGAQASGPGTQSGSTAPTQQAQPAGVSSDLPFTGADLLVLVGAGGALLAVGLTTRHFAREKR